ncbi:MAG: hypothetical protein GF317_13675 [Candidatus Lokiarchaeota archaeon]|nr:hypothetical protein [Candidatus Lokiarchaeota archaeon]MBD3200682.1 hypothetical protein [Candidatus Lokiarchaeota archaeon]
MKKKTYKEKKRILVISIFISCILLSSLFLIAGVPPKFLREQNFKNDESKERNTLRSSDIYDQIWWNESFRYRIRLNLTEQGFNKRTNEPVSINLNFENGKCHKNTIRIIDPLEGMMGDEVPYQISEISTHSSNYIESARVTFLATVNKSDTRPYFIYYSDQDNNGKIFNPNQKYIDNSDFTSNFNGTNVSISTTKFDLEFGKNRGFYNFSDKDSLNYHNEDSLAPWHKNANIDDNVYSPDGNYGGMINDWLVVGPFDYFDPDWNNPVTDSQYHIDISSQYIEGDYATGGDATGFLDESKQWEYVDFQTVGSYSSREGYVDLNYHYGGSSSGNPEYVCAYASAYIKSPVDLNNVYLKVGSDDGIRVWRDGVKIHDNHVLRGPAPDRENVDIGPMTFEAGRWYYFTVLVEENTGNWGFNFRFSNSSSLYASDPDSDPNAIENLDIAMRPPLPVISDISEVQTGPIYSTYYLEWEDSSDLVTWETITIYNDYEFWKSRRSFGWKTDNVNTSFSVFNSLYKVEEGASIYFDYIFYDDLYDSLTSQTTYNCENYSILRDNSGSNDYTDLGIFMTNKEKGHPSMNLEYLEWAIGYDGSSIVNIRPGNETDLDTNGGHTYPAQDNYNITITYWEYLNESVSSTLNNARDKFNNYYLALQNPIIISKGSEESSFFDLTVNVTDNDGFNVENVKVYIYNSSIEEVRNPEYTDINGISTFSRLQNGTYLLNFTYSDLSGEFNVRNNVLVILNETKTVLVSVNLTSLNLTLKRDIAGTPVLSGADVEFWFLNTTGEREYLINTITSDTNGNVAFYWKTISSSEGNISISIYALDGYRKIKVSVSPDEYSYNTSYNFETQTVDDVLVLIFDYTTYLERLYPSGESITDKFWQESIYFEYRYYWINQSNSLETNITDASVTFRIIESSTRIEKGTGILNEKPDKIGFYNNSIDTDNVAFNLQAGVTYEIQITASKSGYTTRTSTVSLTLKEILTNLTATLQSQNINVKWDQQFSLRVYYNDSNGIGLNGSSVTYNVPGTSLQGNLDEENLDGWYNITLNSNTFPQVGTYVIYVQAIRQNYEFKEISININITAIPTTLIPNVNQLNQIFGFNFSITLEFNDTDNNLRIQNATISYRALGTINTIEGYLKSNLDGTYTLNLNTSEFLFTRSYFLRFRATNDNYQTQEIDIPLIVRSIPTLINGTYSLVEEIDVFVSSKKLLWFNFTDELTSKGISDATATYRWKETGGVFKSGILTESISDGFYLLDFDTNNRAIDTYTLVITFEKTNYETRSITFLLNINPREFNSSFTGGIITLTSGESFTYQITLRDSVNSSELIENANVSMNFLGKTYTFIDNNDGTYTVTIPSSNIPVAFFSVEPYLLNIQVVKSNYTAKNIQFTLRLNMVEIWPGMPMFYFLMLVIGIGAVVGSLATYRYVQLARIPEFVKRARKMKKEIQGRKSISDSNLYPPKEQFIVDALNDKWEILELDLSEILGVKEKGAKTNFEKNKTKGGNQ